ncbi:MAG: 50S ribosomal protein L10 [Parcubacteria group bacterium]|nr:50S ribosomal protein L10 [Parcubacteria group bacterium]
MPQSRQQKEEVLKTLVDSFGKAKSVVFVNFDKLTVADITDFRRRCIKQGLTYVVAKKTLLNLALKENQLTEVDINALPGGVGTVFGLADEVAPAQTVAGFAKDHEAMSILGGMMSGNPVGQRLITVEAVQALSKLPSKEVLLGQMVRTINAPVTGFVNVLAGSLRALVQVLDAVKSQKPA